MRFLKIALRNSRKQKLSFLINVVGLATGIACCVMVFLYVEYELGFDRFHEKADRIYRLAVSASLGGTDINQTYSSGETFRRVTSEFPEVETGTRIWRLGTSQAQSGNKSFFESRMLAADSTFFEVFSFPLAEGDSANALTEPNSLVLTESAARKYFGQVDVVGELMTLYFDEPESFRITGVAKDTPGNSHFKFDFLISLVSFPDVVSGSGWTDNRFISYLVLHDGLTETQLASFAAGLKSLDRKYNDQEGSYDDWIAKGNYWEFFLQPLTSIHLNSDLNGEFEPNGQRAHVYMLLAIGLIILLIACVNFMNLSTAHASRRAREVGIRKVVGSGRKRLIAQFMGESLFVSLLALGIAILLIDLLLPSFSQLVNRPLELHYFDNIMTIPMLLVLGFAVGAISGVYPAFVLSSFHPVVMLKGGSIGGRGTAALRSGLIAFQFSAAVILITSTITINRQLNYMLDKDAGFNREQVLVVNNPGTLTDNIGAFKETLRGYAGVIDVSGASSVPGNRFHSVGMREKGRDEGANVNVVVCGNDYLKTLKMEMVAGRFFSPDFTADSLGIVLNEAACKLLDWANPMGKELSDGWGFGTYTVIGVVRDMNYESLHQSVKPLVLLSSAGPFQLDESKLVVRLRTENVPATVASISETWDQFAPGVPFQYSFLDEDYAHQYTSEMQTRQLSTTLCALAIFISCIGLFGLASFTADRMSREISIRRVLGASVTSILILFNSAFIKWVLLSNVIAWPIAWYLMHRWLENFAYRVNLEWWVFGLSTATVIAIAMITISYQSVMTAGTNPVEILRNE
jgi:putative ABC transport system permease protein